MLLLNFGLTLFFQTLNKTRFCYFSVLYNNIDIHILCIAQRAVPETLKFLLKWPRPEDLLQAKYEEIHEFLKPLGLGALRSLTIMKFTGRPNLYTCFDMDVQNGFFRIIYNNYISARKGLCLL